MENESIVVSGKTVDEAIELAATELGVGRGEVAVDVISRGRTGILGIGAEPAQVRAHRIEGGSTSASSGLSVVSDLLRYLDVEARATVRSAGTGPDDPATIDVQGEDAGLLIGRRGESLRAFQLIVNAVLASREEAPVLVDVEHYRYRREEQIRHLADRVAGRVASTGRPVALDPMTPADRRILHMHLADSTSVQTESHGEGAERHVVVAPIRDQPPPRHSQRPRSRRA